MMSEYVNDCGTVLYSMFVFLVLWNISIALIYGSKYVSAHILAGNETGFFSLLVLLVKLSKYLLFQLRSHYFYGWKHDNTDSSLRSMAVLVGRAR